MSACTFIGHSSCDEAVSGKLYRAIEELITNHNATTFYVGTHGRFDRLAREALFKLEKIYPIEVLVVLSRINSVPSNCEKATLIFPEEIEKAPYKYSIIKRNQYMIKNSQFMVCCINHTFTNTYSFVKYAKSKKLNIINLGDFDLNKI